MNIDQYENKIISYFEGELNTVESKLLLDEVESDTGAISRVFEEYQSLYQAMVSESKIEVPSERMQANFDNWLNEETAPKAKVVLCSSYDRISTLQQSRKYLYIICNTN